MQKMKHFTQETFDKLRENRIYEHDRQMREYILWKKQQRKNDEQKNRCHPECIFM